MYKQRRLSAGEVNYLMTARKLKKTKAEIARELKVTEGAIRYRLKRAESGAVDGRKHRTSGVDRYGEVIAHWVEGEGSVLDIRHFIGFFFLPTPHRHDRL